MKEPIEAKMEDEVSGPSETQMSENTNANTIISDASIQKRVYWIDEIQKLSGDFSSDYSKLEKELSSDIKTGGVDALLTHLRLSGDIPEQYSHDSSEEKLYSKYTDAILAETFQFLGFRSLVITERADAADVEVYARNYSFVADAKAFRLSRTAKNQKDFKVQAMDGWKRGKPFAMVVCPIYQLPAKSSQIYQQATTRSVCVFTYSHLAMMVSYCAACGVEKSEDLLLNVFNSINAMNPSKDSQSYWATVNSSMLRFDTRMGEYWRAEKIAAIESIAVAKEQALVCLAKEREAIMRMSHTEALRALLEAHNIENRIKVVQSVSSNSILDMGGTIR